jgi:hypothetical protein
MWEKPELVVLLRSKPEEAVLVSCKVGVNDVVSITSPSPSHHWGNCVVGEAGGWPSEPCIACDASVPS